MMKIEHKSPTASEESDSAIFFSDDTNASPHAAVRLLVRLNANSNPNRQDHLMRVSEANGLDGIRDLESVLNVQYVVLVSMSPVELNTLLAGGTLHGVAPHLIAVNRKRLSKYGLSRNARVCPKCVAENIPQSQVFNSDIPISCPIHKILPLDFCPGCGDSISYLRRKISRCNCGYKFAEAVGHITPMWLQFMHSIFAPWHLIGFADNEFKTIATND